jgi:2'-5' RNA ligase
VGASAFIVRVPEAEPCVGELRLRYDESARLGVPAHITILFPFMDVEVISEAVLERAAIAIRAVSCFEFQLSEVGRFPQVAYLVPEPAASFVELTKALTSSFPDFPLYEGRHSTVVPHLTVASGTEEGAEYASRALSMWLGENGPIQSRCAGVALLENSTGFWKEMHWLPFASR